MYPVWFVEFLSCFKKIIEIHEQWVVSDFLYHTVINPIPYLLERVVYVDP